MKVLSMDDFISIFQLIDVDDVDVVSSLPFDPRFARQCIPCGTTIRMDMSVSVTSFTRLRMRNAYVSAYSNEEKGTDNERMDYIFRTADLTCDSGIVRFFSL